MVTEAGVPRGPCTWASSCLRPRPEGWGGPEALPLPLLPTQPHLFTSCFSSGAHASVYPSTHKAIIVLSQLILHHLGALIFWEVLPTSHQQEEGGQALDGGHVFLAPRKAGGGHRSQGSCWGWQAGMGELGPPWASGLFCPLRPAWAYCLLGSLLACLSAFNRSCAWTQTREIEAEPQGVRGTQTPLPALPVPQFPVWEGGTAPHPHFG